MSDDDARLVRLIDALAEARIERDALREKLRRVVGALRDVDRVAEAAREVARRAEAVMYGEEPNAMQPVLDAIVAAPPRDGHTPTLPPRDDGRGPT